MSEAINKGFVIRLLYPVLPCAFTDQLAMGQLIYQLTNQIQVHKLLVTLFFNHWGLCNTRKICLQHFKISDDIFSASKYDGNIIM